MGRRKLPKHLKKTTVQISVSNGTIKSNGGYSNCQVLAEDFLNERAAKQTKL